MYLPLLYCIMAVVCRLYEMLYPCICNVVISCWKSGAYDFVICHGGTDMCFVPGSGWKHVDLEQYRISGLTSTIRQSSANAASRGRGRGRGNQAGRDGGGGGHRSSGGGERGRGRHGNNTYTPRQRCQLCRKPGHAVMDCWKRFEEDYVPDERHVAAALREQGGEYVVWYADSDATDHITSELEKLAVLEKYFGN